MRRQKSGKVTEVTVERREGPPAAEPGRIQSVCFVISDNPSKEKSGNNLGNELSFLPPLSLKI